MKIISIKFKQGGKAYTSPEYYCKTILPVSIGQEVVVDHPDMGRRVALVYDVNPPLDNSIDDMRLVMQVYSLIDSERFKAIETMKNQYAKVKVDLENKAVNYKEKVYDYLASVDLEFAAMYLYYKSLQESLKEIDPSLI